MSERADWVARHFKLLLSPFQQNCVDLICAAQGCGPYDFTSTFRTANWQFGKGVRFTVRPMRLATFDFDGLTSLVLGAHEHCIRVEITPCNMQRLYVDMHPRERDGRLYQRHPTIEQAIAIRRKAA